MNPLAYLCATALMLAAVGTAAAASPSSYPYSRRSSFGIDLGNDVVFSVPWYVVIPIGAAFFGGIYYIVAAIINGPKEREAEAAARRAERAQRRAKKASSKKKA